MLLPKRFLLVTLSLSWTTLAAPIPAAARISPADKARLEEDLYRYTVGMAGLSTSAAGVKGYFDVQNGRKGGLKRSFGKGIALGALVGAGSVAARDWDKFKGWTGDKVEEIAGWAADRIPYQPTADSIRANADFVADVVGSPYEWPDIKVGSRSPTVKKDDVTKDELVKYPTMPEDEVYNQVRPKVPVGPTKEEGLGKDQEQRVKYPTPPKGTKESPFSANQ